MKYIFNQSNFNTDSYFLNKKMCLFSKKKGSVLCRAQYVSAWIEISKPFDAPVQITVEFTATSCPQAPYLTAFVLVFTLGFTVQVYQEQK